MHFQVKNILKNNYDHTLKYVKGFWTCPASIIKHQSGIPVSPPPHFLVQFSASINIIIYIYIYIYK